MTELKIIFIFEQVEKKVGQFTKNPSNFSYKLSFSSQNNGFGWNPITGIRKFFSRFQGGVKKTPNSLSRSATLIFVLLNIFAQKDRNFDGITAQNLEVGSIMI
jgi:hypothetical protein